MQNDAPTVIFCRSHPQFQKSDTLSCLKYQLYENQIISCVTVIREFCGWQAQDFEGTIKWSMKMNITDPKMKAQMEEAERKMKDPATQAQMKQAMEKMNDPRSKKWWSLTRNWKSKWNRWWRTCRVAMWIDDAFRKWFWKQKWSYAVYAGRRNHGRNRNASSERKGWNVPD